MKALHPTIEPTLESLALLAPAQQENTETDFSEDDRIDRNFALIGQAGFGHKGTAIGRLPLPHEVADGAVLAASDRTSAMTGAIVNPSCGSRMGSN